MLANSGSASYRHLFNHLGEPLPSARPSKAFARFHRIVQTLGAIVIVACLAMLIWGRA